MNKAFVYVVCSIGLLVLSFGCSQKVNEPSQTNKIQTMELSKKDKVVALLNSFNTGDQTPISYINPNQYIQHNLAVGDGLAGFGEVIQNAPPGGFSTQIIRAFQDGDYVFTHTVYDFFGPKIGFDVFRFEDDLIVEHWDNLIEVMPKNPSGRSQTDGPTEIVDKSKTEENKRLVESFVTDILVNGQMDKLTTYFDGDHYLQHNPSIGDGLSGLGTALKAMAEQGITMEYHKIHKVLGEGNFVLTMSEGSFAGAHTSYYDLFRVEDGKIAEHWDVMETILEESAHKNKNGKF